MLRFSMMPLMMSVMTTKIAMPFHGYLFIPWISVKGNRKRIVGKVLRLGSIALSMMETTYAIARPPENEVRQPIIASRTRVGQVRSLSIPIPGTICRVVLGGVYLKLLVS